MFNSRKRLPVQLFRFLSNLCSLSHKILVLNDPALCNITLMTRFYVSCPPSRDNVSAVKPPPDHITVHYPMTGRIHKSSAVVWRRARPSRCMAFMTLVFLSSRHLPEGRLAARWLIDFGAASRLNFMATMAAMFGSRWLQSSDHRVLSLRNLSASDCLDVDPEEAGLWMPFMLCMVGQVRVEGLTELIRDNPLHWERDLPRVKAIPGSDRLLADVDLILAGRHGEVSWAVPVRGESPELIQGLTERSVRSMRPGDALILEPASRSISLSGLLKKARSVALGCSDDRRLYTAGTIEYPKAGNFCVVVCRTR